MKFATKFKSHVLLIIAAKRVCSSEAPKPVFSPAVATLINKDAVDSTPTHYDNNMDEEHSTIITANTSKDVGYITDKNTINQVLNWLDKVVDTPDEEFSKGAPDNHLLTYRMKQKIMNTKRVPISVFMTLKSRFSPLARTVNQHLCDTHGCNVPLNLAGVWGYGCWCNFGYDLMKGQGQPVNEYDEVCKNLQLCLRCAKIDSIRDGYSCDPKTQHYNATFQSAPENAGTLAGCAELNNFDHCSTHCCTCELTLIDSLLNLVWSRVKYDPKYKHSRGFNYEENCKIKRNNNSGSSEKKRSCCGRYPTRVPIGGDLACCEETQTIYNPFVFQCCGENGVHGIGSGC